MSLRESWLKFTRKHMDNMMLELQRDPAISLRYWKEMQEDYKKAYGEYYDRTKSEAHRASERVCTGSNGTSDGA